MRLLALLLLTAVAHAQPSGWVETDSGCTPDVGTCRVVDSEPVTITTGRLYRTLDLGGSVVPGWVTITHTWDGGTASVTDRDFNRHTFDSRTDGLIPLDYGAGQINDPTRSFASLPRSAVATITYRRATSARRYERVRNPAVFDVEHFGAVPLSVALGDPETARLYALASEPTAQGMRAAYALMGTDADAQWPLSLALDAARRYAETSGADSVFVDVPDAYGVSGVLHVHDRVYLRGSGSPRGPTHPAEGASANGRAITNLHGGQDPTVRGAVRFLPGASVLPYRTDWNAVPLALSWQQGAQHVLTHCSTSCGVMGLEIDGQVDLQPVAARTASVTTDVRRWYQDSPRHGGIATLGTDRGRVVVQDVWAHDVGANTLLGNSPHVWDLDRVTLGNATDNHFAYGLLHDPRDPATDITMYGYWWGSAWDSYAAHVDGMTLRDVACNPRRDQPGIIGIRGRADGDMESNRLTTLWLVDSLSAAGVWDLGRGSTFRNVYADARGLEACQSPATSLVKGPIWRGRLSRAVYLTPRLNRRQVSMFATTQSDDFAADSVAVYASNTAYFPTDPPVRLTDRTDRSAPLPAGIVLLDSAPASLSAAWGQAAPVVTPPVVTPPVVTPPVVTPRYRSETVEVCRDTVTGWYASWRMCADSTSTGSTSADTIATPAQPPREPTPDPTMADLPAFDSAAQSLNPDLSVTAAFDPRVNPRASDTVLSNATDITFVGVVDLDDPTAFGTLSEYGGGAKGVHLYVEQSKWHMYSSGDSVHAEGPAAVTGQTLVIARYRVSDTSLSIWVGGDAMVTINHTGAGASGGNGGAVGTAASANYHLGNTPGSNPLPGSVVRFYGFRSAITDAEVADLQSAYAGTTAPDPPAIESATVSDFTP